MKSPPLGIGVVGLGHWGPNVAAAFAASSQRARVAALADPRAARLEAIGARHPGANRHEDWRALLADPAVDAVAIATPVATHREIALAAVAAGKPFLLEKPLAASCAEAQEIVRAASAAKLPALVGHTFLYNPAVLGMKRLLDEGRLGRLRALHSVRVNLGPVRTDVDCVWDLAPHDLSIIGFLVGGRNLAPPSRIRTSGLSVLNPPRLDMALIDLEYPGGIWGTARVSWIDPVKTRTVVAVGEKGMAVFDDLSPTPLVFHDSSVDSGDYADDVGGTLAEFRTHIRQGKAEPIEIESGSPLAREARHFLDVVQGGAEPWTPLEQGLEIVRQLEAAVLDSGRDSSRG